MTKFVGRRGQLGVNFEATRGIPVTPTVFVPFATTTFQDRTDLATEDQGFGNIADQDSQYVVMTKGEGEVEAQLYDQAIPYFLGSLLGAVPSSGGGPPYTHTFTLSQTNQAKSLCLYWEDPDRTEMFPFTVVDTVQIAVRPLGIVDWTVGFKSKKAKDWANLTPAYTTLGSKFLHQHLIFKLAGAVGDLGAATAISLKELNLTISRNVIHDAVMGTSEPEDVLSQTISVEGDIMLNLEDDTYRDYMLGGTYRAMEIGFSNGANSAMDLRFPRVSFSEWERDNTLNEIATQKINFKANYDSANALDIISTCTVTNTKASY